MTPLILGGHPALDFLNTAFAPQGQPVEVIGDGRALLGWMEQVGLIEAAVAARLQRRVGARALDESAAEARRLREWSRAWLADWRRPAAADDFAGDVARLARLNAVLARARVSREVQRDATGRLRVVEHPHYESADELVAVLAAQVAALLTDEDPALVKDCAGNGCTLTFLDRSKAHRRLFCSATACGNRAKVAAFRQRQRLA